MTARVKVRVQGRVQAVGFRAFVERQAQGLGVNGWVRNVGDDMVEAVAEAERALLDQFIERMKSGPPGARVDDLQVDWENSTGEFSGFSVRRSL